MKIALAQLNFFVGDFDGNVSKMLAAVGEAKAQGADLVVFPELSTCGYPPRDFLEFDDFIRRSERAVQQLAEAAQGIAIAVGSPSRNPVVQGKVDGVPVLECRYGTSNGRYSIKVDQLLSSSNLGWIGAN